MIDDTNFWCWLGVNNLSTEFSWRVLRWLVWIPLQFYREKAPGVPPRFENLPHQISANAGVQMWSFHFSSIIRSNFGLCLRTSKIKNIPISLSCTSTFALISKCQQAKSANVAYHQHVSIAINLMLAAAVSIQPHRAVTYMCLGCFRICIRLLSQSCRPLWNSMQQTSQWVLTLR